MTIQRLFRAPAPDALLVIRGAHVLDPNCGIDSPQDVVIRDGEIADIAEPGYAVVPEGAETVDGRGRHLFPAFFDPHVHLRTPGQEHKELIETGTRAAAAGGFCGVLAMPNTDPVLDSTALLSSVQDAARRDARVPVGFMPAITLGLKGETLTEMAELREQGAVGFTDDGKPVTSAGMLRKAMRYQKLCGGVIALHEEDPTLSAGGVMHEGEISARLGLAGYPSVGESTMVARDAALALDEEARTHFQHLSAWQSVEALRAAKAAGAPVSGEASPHHLLLTHEEVLSLDTRMKMNPPLRTERDREAIIAGLRDGTIECIATDHAPHAAFEKDVPFEDAPMGTTGLETAFAAVYTGLVQPGVLPLDLVIERFTAGARLMGLPTPEICVGAPANVCLVDLDATWQVGESGYESRSENCCFAGRQLHGKVLLTVAAGAVAYRERSFALSEVR